MPISSQLRHTLSRFKQAQSPEQFAQAIAIRMAVFVDEQQVPIELEQDTDDAIAVHWLLTEEQSGYPIATARMIEYLSSNPTQALAKLQRVAVLSAYRGQGLGKLLTEAMVAYAREQGYPQAILHAQVAVIPFYQSLGFVTQGDVFDEAGIAHQMMCLPLQ